MFNFSKISNRIKANEGFRNCIYIDQIGNPTIGYGHLINQEDNFVLKKKYLKKTLLNIFYIDLKKAIADFKKNYKHKTISDNAQEVIIEMIFQLGIEGMLKFKKFNFFINNKLFYLAALEMMKSKWYQQTPNRVNKLIIVLLQHNVRR